MTTDQLATAIAADLGARRAARLANPAAPPSAVFRDETFAAQLRSTTVERDGKQFIQLDGIASVVDRTYPMFDMFGPYEEKVAAGAFAKTLASDPDVAFLLNHKGMTMARTKVSKTLELGTNSLGDLTTRAFLNPERTDVKDLVHAIDDGDVDQMSFAFRITAGEWNMDFTEFSITEVDLNRGDVSAVNYGANPYTNIAARAKQAFDGIDHLEGPALFAAHQRVQARMAAVAKSSPASAAPTGQNAATLRARLELED
jgi:HK97 family phage prohead protease